MPHTCSSSYLMELIDYTPNDRLYDNLLDRSYTQEACNLKPDYSFETLFGSSSFMNQSSEFIETLSESLWDQKSTTTMPSAGDFASWSSSNEKVFECHEIPDDDTFSITPNSINTRETSPHNRSRTPSLYELEPQSLRYSYPSLSCKPMERESSDRPVKHDIDNDAVSKSPRKKRKSPRLQRRNTHPSVSSYDYKERTGHAQPHTQVERKYREGLNAELHRLWRAVPTLIQPSSENSARPVKPSKVTIMVSAINYIKKIEQERDILQERIEKLEGLKGRREG